MSAHSILAAVLCFALTACSAPGPVEIPVTSTRFDALKPDELVEFRSARAAFDAHDFNRAQLEFERLFAADPVNVCIGTWIQECEFRSGGPAEKIAERWAERARLVDSAPNEVLAARVAIDVESRVAALARAEAIDPQCAWIHYARAFDCAATSDWPAARAQIAKAKESDPGHLWTYWLEAWIATRTAALEDAGSALSGFVLRARDDPRIQRTLLDDARLDLALVWTLTGEPRDARELVLEVDPNGPDAARRFAALALVRQALGDLKGALAAAEDAERVSPDDMLPVVQQALLYDEWLEDDVRAEAAWKRALAMARSSTRLVSVLERTRAGVRLERFAAARAKRERP